jgi:mRNA-degrading endonuclease RelE of RelBE toxin-antitoxin system
MYDIRFSGSALDDLRVLNKNEQRLIFDTVDRQLRHEPLSTIRNRKPLRPNPLAGWELRIGRLRVFYDAVEAEEMVIIKAVGWKEHNTLFLRGREHPL